MTKHTTLPNYFLSTRRNHTEKLQFVKRPTNPKSAKFGSLAVHVADGYTPGMTKEEEIAQAVSAALAEEARKFHAAGGRARMASMSKRERRDMARKGANAANATKAQKRISGRATD